MLTNVTYAGKSLHHGLVNVNYSDAVDVNDVLYIVNATFVNGPNPVDPCRP